MLRAGRTEAQKAQDNQQNDRLQRSVIDGLFTFVVGHRIVDVFGAAIGHFDIVDIAMAWRRRRR